MTKILLINQYAGNKGDRAVLYALIRLLKKSNNNTKITVSTSNPELWKNYKFYKENNIEFICESWNYAESKSIITKVYFNLLNKFKKYTYTVLKFNYLTLKLPIARLIANSKFIKSAKEADHIVSVGGHHFTTILSRDLVSEVSFDLCISLMLNDNVTLFSQSIGPFEFYKKSNRKFIQKILNNCKNILVRENISLNVLNDFKINWPTIKLIPETVISLNNLFLEYKKPTERENIVGISIYSTKKRNKEEKQKYINTFAEVANFLIQRDYKILFIPMELKNTEPDDRIMINQIISKINKKNNCEILDNDLETKEHIQEVSKCKFYIGHKTHSIVFALTSGTPLIAIEYHPKSKEFMTQFNVGEYSVNDSDFEYIKIEKLINQIENNLNEIGASTFEKSKILSLKLEEIVNNLK